MKPLTQNDFETWVLTMKNGFFLNKRSEPGYEHEYEHPWTVGAWEGWQAAHCNDHLVSALNKIAATTSSNDPCRYLV